MHHAPRLTLTVPNKAAKRVIAPYVKVVRKRYKAPTIPESKLFKKHLERKPSVLLRDLTSFLSDNVDLPSLLHESSDVLKITTHSNGVSLYLVESATGEIYQSQRYFDIPEPRVRWKVEEGTIVAAHVASTRELVMIDDILEDERFPMGIGQKDQLTKSVLCVPVVTPDGDCFAVIELFRDTSQDPFDVKDLKIATLVTGWMGAAIFQNLQRVAVHKKQELNDYLLELTKVYLEEYVPAEKMITEMVKFVKVTLAAERSSFYLLDREDEDLVADVYEKGIEETEGIQKYTNIKLVGKEKEIIASVAKTGISVNIKDAFNDPKLGKQVDVQTGFIVRSVLCMAVKGNADVLGVIEVVNKKNGCFTRSDEILFEVFAKYFALVLQFNNLYQHLKEKEKLNILYMALLDRQIEPCIHDYNHFMKNSKIKLPASFFEFKWHIQEELINEIPLLTFAMIKEFSEPEDIDVSYLARFILAMRKYEANLPFHNFEHAFDFCHCMFNILKRNPDIFTPIEIKALMIAGLAHCVGRDKCTTNEFLIMTNDDLYQLYPVSPLQNFHFYITARLLEQFPFFKNLTKADYKLFLKEVKQGIIDTDLRNSFFAKNFKLIAILIKTKTFDNDNPQHHYLLKALCIASCDFTGFSKPYLVGRKIALNLFYELCQEGEKIKRSKPDSIMMGHFDASSTEKIAEQQLNLLDNFVMRTALLLKAVLPNTGELLNGIIALRKTWIDIIELRGRKIWKQEDSYRKKRM